MQRNAVMHTSIPFSVHATPMLLFISSSTSLITVPCRAVSRASLDDRNSGVVCVNRWLTTNAIEAGHGGSNDSISLWSSPIDGAGESDRGQNVAERRAKVGGGEDGAEGARVAITGGNAKGDTDVVDGLDVVGSVEGQSEGLSSGDGRGNGQACDDGAGRDGEGQEGGEDGELHFEGLLLREFEGFEEVQRVDRRGFRTGNADVDW